MPTTMRDQIAEALEPMRAATAASILSWMRTQVEHYDAELAAATSELENAVRGTPAQRSPWNTPGWMHGGLYAVDAEAAIEQGRKLLGDYTLATRRVGDRGGNHRYARAAIAQAAGLAAKRDRLPQMADAWARDAISGMVSKLTNKLEAAGAIVSHACHGVNRNYFTLDVVTDSGRLIRVATKQITNYRHNRPYWQWPSRLSELMQGGAWRPVPFSKIGQAAGPLPTPDEITLEQRTASR